MFTHSPGEVFIFTMALIAFAILRLKKMFTTFDTGGNIQAAARKGIESKVRKWFGM